MHTQTKKKPREEIPTGLRVLAGHSLLMANTMVHVTAWGFVAAVRLPTLGA